MIRFASEFDNAVIEISADGETLLSTTASGRQEVSLPLNMGRDCVLKIACLKGRFTLDTIEWQKA